MMTTTQNHTTINVSDSAASEALETFLNEPTDCPLTGKKVPRRQIYFGKFALDLELVWRAAWRFAKTHQSEDRQSEDRRVLKVGGSFQHTGTVVAEFVTNSGEKRIVVEFDAPTSGLLHIYRPDQVKDYIPDRSIRSPWLPLNQAPTDSTVVLFCDEHGNRWVDCSPGHPGNGCGFPAIKWMHLPPG